MLLTSCLRVCVCVCCARAWPRRAAWAAPQALQNTLALAQLDLGKTQQSLDDLSHNRVPPLFAAAAAAAAAATAATPAASAAGASSSSSSTSQPHTQTQTQAQRPGSGGTGGAGGGGKGFRPGAAAAAAAAAGGTGGAQEEDLLPDDLRYAGIAALPALLGSVCG